MWPLVRKNGFLYLIYFLILIPFLTYWFFVTRMTFSIFRVIFLAQWTSIILMAGLFGTEQIEAKSKGYHFLKILPISDHSVVVSKFLTTLIAALSIMTFHNILLFFVSGHSLLVSVGRILILAGTCIGLIICGISYFLIFRFGLQLFLRIAAGVLVSLFVIPIILVEIVFVPLDVDYALIFRSMSSSSALIFIILILLTSAAYWMLMRFSIRAKILRDLT